MTRWLSIPLFASALFSAQAGAQAGELTVTWRANDDDVTAGYVVEVRDQDGFLIQSHDARAKTRAVLRELPDNQLLSVSIRPYDEYGNRARQASTPIVTYPTPRVDAIDGEVQPGRSFKLTLYGANFADDARVLAKRRGITVLNTTVLRSDAAIVELLVDREGALRLSDFYVANPVRRAAEYLDAHPELLDLDQSGTIDAADLARVEASFGQTAARTPGGETLDLNADGLIDGEDAAVVRRHLNHADLAGATRGSPGRP
jgi:hypothetical protein